MANPQNTNTEFQFPQKAQWVERDGDTRDMAGILGSTIRSGSLYGTLSVTTAATAIRVGGSDLAKRHLVLIANTSANDIFVGFNTSVTTANGIPIRSGDERSFAFDPNDGLTIYGISSAASVVRLAEVK